MKLVARSRDFILGVFVSLFLVVGCASNWTYTHYTLDVESLPEAARGKLKAVDPKNDKTLEMCMPTATSKAPCNVMMEDVYFKLKDDFQRMEKRLIACEQRNQ